MASKWLMLPSNSTPKDGTGHPVPSVYTAIDLLEAKTEAGAWAAAPQGQNKRTP